MKHTLLLPMLAALLLFGCTKDNDPPPEPTDRCPWPEVTTEGKNTLGFKINGEEWVPCTDLSSAFAGIRPIEAGFGEDNDFLTILGHYFLFDFGDSTHNWYQIGFWPITKGKIELENLLDCSFDFDKSYNGKLLEKWKLPESKEGLEIEILRLDEEQNIISGIFEAILIPEIGHDTLYITEGRFDVTYTPQ
jgi:hypothetical protein